MRGRTIEFEVTDKRGKAAKTIPLYQYDYGQKLLIKGVELPEYYEVHFSNQQYGDAITVLGDSTGVLIPDSLVATGETIYVWLFLHDTSYDGETEYMGAIPVIKRAQPTDVTPTPEEQSIITEVIAALNNMEDDMSEQVQAAEAAKEAAQTAQTAAEGAATTASGYVDTVTAAQTAAEAAQAAAETAATSATASATSATSSANSANNALAEATNAKIAAVDAASAASTSATTATTASGNASNYATSAESAKVDAVAAKVAAEAAQTAAETAQGKAEDAQGAAETAQTAAEAAQTAAEAAQGKAEDAQEAAKDSAEDSEAYAVGTRNGVDVESDDPAYENNAKYYAEEAATVLEDKLDAPATAGTAGQVLTSDGEGGQAWADPSGAIDDTAGEGDTDVTWSADKLDGEFADVLTAIQGKQTAPETAGTAGQVLGLNNSLEPVWLTPSGGGVVDADFSDSSTNPVQNKVITAVVNGVTEKLVSPNLYDKNTCNPQDGKVYNNSHQYTNSSSYAVTGKMPVEPNTQYIFTTLGIAAVQYVAQWSGEDGSTFVSETKIQGAAFTTGTNTTFVEFEIFARSHTATEYTNAINSAMLIKGGTAPEVYEPYGKVTYTVPTSALNDAEAVEGAKNYTVMRSLVNIYDKSLAVDNKVFNTNKLVDSTNYAFTGLIPVEPNKQYCFSIQKGLEYGYISAYYQRWDSSKTFIDEVAGSQATNFLNQIQTTATTAYISFCIYFGAAHTTEAFNTAIDTLMVVEGCQQPSEYVPYNLEPVMNHLKIDTMYRDNADRFKGKRWLVTGTSVSYQDSKYYTEGVAEGEVVRGYIGNIARRKPMLVTNVAVSGSTLAGSDTNALINRYQNLDMGNYDFITIEYGINDFGNNVIVGTAQDAPGTGTFAACLKTIIEYALNQNPIVGLIICTDPDVRGTNVNQNGNTLKDYADVMLEIAAQYRLPVCDWFYHSGINSITKGDGSSRYFLTQSGTHPSVYGHMRMGAMLNQVFDSLLC